MTPSALSRTVWVVPSSLVHVTHEPAATDSSGGSTRSPRSGPAAWRPPRTPVVGGAGIVVVVAGHCGGDGERAAADRDDRGDAAATRQPRSLPAGAPWCRGRSPPGRRLRPPIWARRVRNSRPCAPRWTVETPLPRPDGRWRVGRAGFEPTKAYAAATPGNALTSPSRVEGCPTPHPGPSVPLRRPLARPRLRGALSRGRRPRGSATSQPVGPPRGWR